MDISSGPAVIPPEERACAALCLASVCPFALLVLLDSRVSAYEYFRLVGAFLGIAAGMLVGTFVCFALLELGRAGRRSGWQASPVSALAAAFARKWRENRFFPLAWPIVLFVLLLPTFNAFKQRILPHAGFVYDRQLASIDRALFGTDPGPHLHWLIGSPAVTRLFDAIYHSWFLPTILGVCVVGLCASARTRAQYMLAYSGVWIILGAVLAYLFPAAGPAFYYALVDPAGAEPFLVVHKHLVATGGDGSFLTSLSNQAYLLRNMDAPVLVVGGGISAIPSVHNAISVLFALACFRAGKVLGIAASLFALMIWVASVYLNWHYAVDGVLGGAGAAAIWFGSGRLVDSVLARLAGRSPAGELEPIPSSA